MLSVESYIGNPEKNSETGLLDIVLDSSIQTNLDSICELVLTIFDAQACLITANFSQGPITLSECGESLSELNDNQQASINRVKQFEEFVLDTNPNTNADSKNTASTIYQAHSPIIFPSGLVFGMLIFERHSESPLDGKEKAILSILQRDITNHLIQQKQAFEEAKSTELHTLISKHNQDWIFVKDESFRIVYANDAFLGVYPENMQDKIIGFTTLEEYDVAEAELFLADDKTAFEKGICIVTEDLHMPDGQHIIVETVKRRFEDEYGKAYILGVCRNVTRREHLIRELKKANDELDDFTSIASHDLKSPLNAIKRLLEWIEEDCKALLPEEHLENLNLVMNRADRMQVLLDDLLRYARIDQGDISTAEINLAEVKHDVTQLLDLPKNITVNIDEGMLTVPVVPFKTVMLNLIGNAIKHNDKAEGLVKVTMLDSRHHYIIEVSDNGPGIEPKYFDRIFQLFQTLRSRDELEGSGIGLSVVMKHLNNFDGKIEVESDGKLGSTFRVYWPKKAK